MLRRRTKSGTKADGKSNAENIIKRVPGVGPEVRDVEVDASTGAKTGDVTLV